MIPAALSCSYLNIQFPQAQTEVGGCFQKLVKDYRGGGIEWWWRWVKSMCSVQLIFTFQPLPICPISFWSITRTDHQTDYSKCWLSDQKERKKENRWSKLWVIWKMSQHKVLTHGSDKNDKRYWQIMTRKREADCDGQKELRERETGRWIDY